MTPQPHRSFWLQEVAGDAPDAPPLAGHHTTDVAIIGGGDVGLWTAGRRHLIYGVGWSGNGVGPSVVGGRVLASMALGRQDHWGQYPLIGRSAGSFPPEPIRFLGAHVVRTAVARKERREIVGAKPSWLATQVARLAPAGLEDKAESSRGPRTRRG